MLLGKRAPGSGGAPTFLGSTGGLPVYMGAGSLGYLPSGGAPVFTGSVDAQAPSSGGYPVYMGTGGVHAAGGRSPVDAGPIPTDAPADSGPVDWCNAGVAPFCYAYCVPLVGDGSAISDCRIACGTDAGLGSCAWTVHDGTRYARCIPMCTGRRPPGLADRPIVPDGAVRAYFEEMSRLEAASVPAFRQLAHELRAHGAPRSLLRAARRAARDEVRHTRMGTALAERFGGGYVRPQIARKPLRSVEEIATDNAVEGCVRETFGAMMATWQARAASDPVVRRIMRRVAVDETRHAALALRVARWADQKLDAAGKRKVRDARREGVAQVMRELVYSPSPALVAIAGVPRAEDARHLASVMSERLWS